MPLFFPETKGLALIVEDEPLVRRVAEDVVIAAGLEPLEAETAEQALEILEACTGVRLLFADIGLPGGMTGAELATAVRTRWPDIEIVLTSGHQIQSDIEFSGRKAFVVKPYDVEATAALIRDMLEPAPVAKETIAEL